MSTDVFSAVQLRLDEAGGATFFTAAQIYDALNEVALALMGSGKYSTSSASLTVSAGATSVAIPTGTFIPQFILIAGKKVYFTTRARLEQFDPGWQTTKPATPSHFVLTAYNTLMPWPTPDITYTATLWGVPYPSAEISATNSLSDFPPLLSDALVYGAMNELLEHTHPLLADGYAKEADEYLNRFKKQLRNRQAHNISALTPATGFQAGQSGDIKPGLSADQLQNYVP